MKKGKERGIFITFEGPECAGKTTQIGILKECLTNMGRDVITTREPGGTDIGEQLRDIVKHHIGATPITDEAEVLLFAASRAQHIGEVIKPALDCGKIVICDRFIDSTISYQGYARGLDMKFISILNSFAISGNMPDITFLLDLTAEESMERSVKREETVLAEDRIESEKLSFHKLVREGFLKIAKSAPDRIKVISAMDSIETIHNKILDQIEKLVARNEV